MGRVYQLCLPSEWKAELRLEPGNSGFVARGLVRGDKTCALRWFYKMQLQACAKSLCLETLQLREGAYLFMFSPRYLAVVSCWLLKPGGGVETPGNRLWCICGSSWQQLFVSVAWPILWVRSQWYFKEAHGQFLFKAQFEEGWMEVHYLLTRTQFLTGNRKWQN